VAKKARDKESVLEIVVGTSGRQYKRKSALKGKMFASKQFKMFRTSFYINLCL